MDIKKTVDEWNENRRGNMKDIAEVVFIISTMGMLISFPIIFWGDMPFWKGLGFICSALIPFFAIAIKFGWW